MNRVLIAGIVNNLSAALAACIAEPDATQIPTWGEAGKDWREFVMQEVDKKLANPDATPADQHAEWLARMLSEGWTYGEVRNPEAKHHPLVLPWEELPIAHRMKNTAIHALILELRNVPDAPSTTAGEPLAPAAAAVIPAAPVRVPGQHVPVKYIGKRPEYRDGTYQTGIVWKQGETKPVPAEKARLMLMHRDVYADGALADIATQAAAPAAPAKPKDMDEEGLQDTRDRINQMTKQALADFAKTNFQQDLDAGPKVKVADLRARVTQLVDQYGLPA